MEALYTCDEACQMELHDVDDAGTAIIQILKDKKTEIQKIEHGEISMRVSISGSGRVVGKDATGNIYFNDRHSTLLINRTTFETAPTTLSINTWTVHAPSADRIYAAEQGHLTSIDVATGTESLLYETEEEHILINTIVPVRQSLLFLHKSDATWSLLDTEYEVELSHHLSQRWRFQEHAVVLDNNSTILIAQDFPSPSTRSLLLYDVRCKKATGIIHTTTSDASQIRKLQRSEVVVIEGAEKGEQLRRLDLRHGLTKRSVVKSEYREVQVTHNGKVAAAYQEKKWGVGPIKIAFIEL